MKFLLALLLLCAALPAQAAQQQMYYRAYPDRFEFWNNSDPGSDSGNQRVLQLKRSTITLDQPVTLSSTVTVTGLLTLTAGLAANLTLVSGATIGQSADNKLTLTENSENLELTYAADLVTFGSTTSATFAFTPAVSFTGAISPVGGISTTIANGANAACSTTCAAKACITGFDAGTTAFVLCSSALADTCLCGP